MSEATTELTCFLCSRPLSGKQTRFCSLKCQKYVSAKKHYKKYRTDKVEKEAKKFKYPFEADITKVSFLPSWLKPGKGKRFKIKKSTVQPKKKNSPKNYFKPSKKEEKNMWKWYWDVRNNIEPLEPGMKDLYQAYHYKMFNDKFTSI